MLQLPSNRRLLQASFLIGFMPAYLALVTVGSGCSGGCSGGFRVAGADGLTSARPGGFDGDVFFGYADDPTSDVVFAVKKKVTVMSITLGMPYSLPPGAFTLFGDVQVLGSARAAPPAKFNIWLDHLPAGDKKKNVFKTVLKRKGNQLAQTKNGFKGLDMEAGDTAVFVAKPKGGDLTRDQLYHLFYAIVPTEQSSPLDWLTAGLRYGAVVPRLQAALAEAPNDAATLPMPAMRLPAAAAGAKMLIAELGFGFPLATNAYTVLFGGDYIQATAGSNVPDSVDIDVTILDKDGKQVARVTGRSTLAGTTIPQTEIRLPAIALPAGGKIRVEATPNGGNIENGDQMQGFIVYFEED